jgi:hypothetical protein
LLVHFFTFFSDRKDTFLIKLTILCIQLGLSGGGSGFAVTAAFGGGLILFGSVSDFFTAFIAALFGACSFFVAT